MCNDETLQAETNPHNKDNDDDDSGDVVMIVREMKVIKTTTRSSETRRHPDRSVEMNDFCLLLPHSYVFLQQIPSCCGQPVDSSFLSSVMLSSPCQDITPPMRLESGQSLFLSSVSLGIFVVLSEGVSPPAPRPLRPCS